MQDQLSGRPCDVQIKSQVRHDGLQYRRIRAQRPHKLAETFLSRLARIDDHSRGWSRSGGGGQLYVIGLIAVDEPAM